MPLILCTKEAADNYLAHYRRGGEKKGVRRWQNKDGSYTPEGYKHYAEMYGWGQKRNSTNRKTNAMLESIREIEGTDAWKKINKALSSISEIDSQISSLASDRSLSPSEWRKKDSELSERRSSIWNDINEYEQKIGITSSESYFTRDALSAVRDETVRKDVTKALSKNEDFTELKKVVSDTNDLLEEQNKMFSALLDDYEKKRGSPWDGDGTEAHEELVKHYPEYAKLNRRVDDFEKRIQKSSSRLADKAGISLLKSLKKYCRYYDKITDPATGKPWYKIGNLAAIAVAAAAGVDVDYVYVHLLDFIQSYDSNGRPIKG